MSYTSNYNLNIRLSALESKINAGVPTSSDLGDVLLNGNSAGATDIDMNLQSITNATAFLSADNGNSIDVDGSSATLTIADNLGNINVITAIGSSVPSPNADSILTTTTTANATFYPTFLGATTGYNSAGVSTSLTFNPFTKTETLTDGINSTVISPTGVSSTTFTGGLSGNANSATNIAGGLGGSIPYQSAVNNTAFLANGTSGQYLKSNGTTLAPSWENVAASGLNDVLAIGDTATNKTIYMFNTNDLELSGDNIIMSNAINPGINTTLTYDEINCNNGFTKSLLSPGFLNLTDDTSTPTIDFTELSTTDLKITGSNASLYNTLTSISSVLNNIINNTTITPSSITQVLNADITINRSVLNNLGLTLTGSTTSITNTIIALSNIITDGTRTLTSGIISSVATFKALALSGGKSTVITPDGLTTTTLESSPTVNYFNTASNSTELRGGSSAYFIRTKVPMNGAYTSTTGQNFGYCIGTNVPSTTFDYSTYGDICVESNSSGQGLVGSLPSLLFRRTKDLIVAGDTLGLINFVGRRATLTYPSYARISSICKNVGASADDGSLLFQASVNSTLTNFLELNGDTQQIDAFKPIDINNNDIVSSTGGITLNATGSSGTGVITLNTKDGTAGTGTGLVLTGNTLTSGTAGGNSGQHLCLTIGGTVYKIALLNP